MFSFLLKINIDQQYYLDATISLNKLVYFAHLKYTEAKFTAVIHGWRLANYEWFIISEWLEFINIHTFN